jgi:hypothetical protein
LDALGVSGPVPSESTFRRTLQRLDADAFDELAGQWTAGRTAPAPGQRRVIAVDGKTLRGSARGGEDDRHLLAALDHGHGVVLGQVEVGAKTNEIPLFSTLLDRIGIQDAVITADVLHAQREHARYLHRRSAHYVITIKRNQPGLHAQLTAATLRRIHATLRAALTERWEREGCRPAVGVWTAGQTAQFLRMVAGHGCMRCFTWSRCAGCAGVRWPGCGGRTWTWMQAR